MVSILIPHLLTIAKLISLVRKNTQTSELPILIPRAFFFSRGLLPARPLLRSIAIAVENKLCRRRRSGIEFHPFSIFSGVGYRPTVACVRRLRVGYRQTRSVVAAAAVGLRMAALPFLPACWAIDGLPFSLPELHVGGLPCSLPDVFLSCSSRQCLPAPISRGGGRRCSRGRGDSSRPVLALIRGPAAAACVTIISEGQRHREGRRHVLARGREGRRDDFCF